MSRYWSKFRCLKGGWVTLNANFRNKGASPTNAFWHQKSRVPELSYGEKIAETFNRLSMVHQRHRQQTPTNAFWHQKSRVPELSYGEKIAETFNRLSMVHQRHRQQTDRRQTDRQTDGIAIACSERNVVTFAKNLYLQKNVTIICNTLLEPAK